MQTTRLPGIGICVNQYRLIKSTNIVHVDFLLETTSPLKIVTLQSLSRSEFYNTSVSFHSKYYLSIV